MYHSTKDLVRVHTIQAKQSMQLYFTIHRNSGIMIFECTLLRSALVHARIWFRSVTSIVGLSVAIFACAHPIARMVSFLKNSLYIVLF